MFRCLVLLCLATHCYSVTTRAYINNFGSNNVTVIDLDTNSVETTLTVGTNPLFSAATPDGSSIYIVNTSSDTVDVIDNTLTPPTVKSGGIYPITVGTNPVGIAINPAGTLAFVANQGSNNVSVIDINPASPTKDQVLTTLATSGTGPRYLSVTPDGLSLYIGSRNSNTVTVYELTSPTPTLRPDIVIGAPTSADYLSINPATGSPIFVTAPLTNQVRFFPNIYGTGDNDPGGTYENPQFLAFTPNGTQVYIPNKNSAPGTVTLIDVTNPTTAAPNAGSPISVADNANYPVINNSGTIAYITHNDGANNGTTVSAINTATLAVTSIPIGGNGPSFAAVTQDNSKVVVSVTGSNLASIINVSGGNVVSSLPVGTSPQFVVIANVPTQNNIVQTILNAEAVTQQNLNLVNETINTSLEQIKEIGIITGSQGTFPDSTNVYIIDGNTSYTLDVYLPPSWCN